ncbi:MAG: UDP-N-acetylmuramoyl-tripeptide--D-alanyl-D-alanine ligase [Candidatus Moraniibacteriota bacterium]
MKQFILNKILTPYLAWCARRIIAWHNPLIIGITGSVGKSSAKEAVYWVLKNRYRVRKSQSNLNNQIGLPLTIISEIEPKGSLLRWAKVLALSLKLSFFRSRKYPRILILEMAVDRPKDMKYLLSIVNCKIGIVSNVGITHLEYFRDEKQILKEKTRLLKQLPDNGLAIINYDDFQLRSFAKNLKKSILSFGFRPGADVRATDLKIGYSPDLGEGVSLAQGISFRAHYKTIYLPLELPNVISKALVYPILAAVAVGVHMGMNLVEIASNLKNFRTLPGRMQLLRGKKGNLIVDDTYNSAPDSAKAALETLALVKSRKKTAILGDMLELGSQEEPAHKELAKQIFPVASKVILVGKRTAITHKELRKLGFSKDKIFHFHLVTSLVKRLPNLVGKGEVILVKGSQGLRMEKVVEVLVPRKNWKYLTRQDVYWKRKSVKKV